MPLATTHILVAIILIELFREYVIKNNFKFPRYYIFVAVIGGVLPDFDFGVYYIMYFFGFSISEIHRTFLHTIFIPIILLLIGLIIYWSGIKIKTIRTRHVRLDWIFFILAAGALLHLLLDIIFTGCIMPFFPFSNWEFGLNLMNIFPVEWQGLIMPTLDGVLLILWIAWTVFKIKTDDFF